MDRVTPRPDKVVKLGELDDDGVVVVSMERRLLEEFLGEDGLEVPASDFLFGARGRTRVQSKALLVTLHSAMVVHHAS